MHCLLKLVTFAIAVQLLGLAPIAKRSTLPVPLAFDQIRLVRTVCFGSCPAYSISISGDGRVVYEGVRFVRKAGRAKSRLSQAQLNVLARSLREVDFFSLRDEYASAADGCGITATDFPSAITTVSLGGKSKTIRHDLSCEELPDSADADFPLSGATYPRALTRFEMLIDELTNSKRWVQMPARAQ